MSLRFKFNAIVALLMILFVAALIAQEIDATRRGVREEVQAANRVAIQLLQRVSVIYASEGPPALVSFLNRLGRVRATDITLLTDDGKLLYRSPSPTYKQGRSAPAWFAALVLPPRARHEIELPGGRLLIETEASRAALDGWDDLVALLQLGLLAFVLVNVAVFWLVGRTLKPFPTIVAGLERLERGDLAVRLPVLPGREAGMIGAAFNRMAAGVEEDLAVRRSAFEAERRLSESRELTQQIERRVEEERREIARELHDELGQSVTAIRSLALSLARRFEAREPESAAAAQLIADEAKRLYEAMHGLIPRLTPLTLDSLGLADALAELVEQARERHADIAIDRSLAPLPESIGSGVALAAYRTAQEGLTNAVRHSGARHIRLAARVVGGMLEMSVEDDGRGLRPDWSLQPGRFGLRGLRERVEALAGRLEVGNRPEGGAALRAAIPLAEAKP